VKLFRVVLVVAVLLLLPRVWDLRLLYLDANVRNQVQAVVEKQAEENGWILSDLYFESVEKNAVSMCRRTHRRGTDPVDCFDFLFKSS